MRWGPGNQITTDVAEKLLALYDRFAQVQSIVDIVLRAQRLLGSKSPFEEYSKLTVGSGEERCDTGDFSYD